MPFIGRDWRSPGEAWVKTESLGWQRMKITCCCCYCCASTNNNQSFMKTAPHCRISTRTKEVAMYNTISEAFYRLDFCNAIHDIRRFNYICKLLHLLITQNLTSLSGCASKVLFTMLEKVAWEVSNNKRNIHILKDLLNELKQMIQKYYCWGRPIGSSLLWQQHFDTIERISQIVDKIELSPPKKDDENQITFDNLPVEMIQEILLRLNDYRDLVSSAQASPVMRMMIDGQYIWQQLCRYHFTEQQLNVYGGNIIHISEQTNAHRSSCQKDSSSDEGSSSSSNVTRVIRIFDKEGSLTASGRARKVDSKKQRVWQSSTAGPSEPDVQMLAGQQTRPSDSSDRSSNEIDWERVFHQLRKKFDLKEEYADCLLLCRHCRCLFWKSFGHPCIKNDDSPLNSSGADSFKFNQQLTSNTARIDDQLTRSQSVLPSQQERLAGQAAGHDIVQESRLSVAALSRNFDNRAAQNQANDENVTPDLNVFANNNNTSRQRRPSSNNLNVPLRELNIRIANRRLNDDNNENRLGDNNSSLDRTFTMRRDELVPKHVAISPQAFLKFFSL